MQQEESKEKKPRIGRKVRSIILGNKDKKKNEEIKRLENTLERQKNNREKLRKRNEELGEEYLRIIVQADQKQIKESQHNEEHKEGRSISE